MKSINQTSANLTFGYNELTQNYFVENHQIIDKPIEDSLNSELSNSNQEEIKLFMNDEFFPFTNLKANLRSFKYENFKHDIDSRAFNSIPTELKMSVRKKNFSRLSNEIDLKMQKFEMAKINDKLDFTLENTVNKIKIQVPNDKVNNKSIGRNNNIHNQGLEEISKTIKKEINTTASQLKTYASSSKKSERNVSFETKMFNNKIQPLKNKDSNKLKEELKTQIKANIDKIGKINGNGNKLKNEVKSKKVLVQPSSKLNDSSQKIIKAPQTCKNSSSISTNRNSNFFPK